ncbi:type II secretion protein F [Nocardiopsis sp. TSRI0078]|uniref:type II secretion system F family protein n=1 Tax=unclassified Nocardiopsis TaxID=2649073 RepID=UPI00093BC7E7|nr:type II secretion system F family protein [Nocardiopsis sp. TSRI0078]OKI20701.1 type II secretion protein F [Nocardiopsis sp. TSRI0078]
MAAVTALVVCAAALVLLYLVPGPPRNRLEAVLARPRRQVRRRVAWRTPAARSGEGAERRRAVVVLCRVLAAELRAGQPPGEALRVSAAEVGPLVGAVADAESLRREAGRDPDLWALAYLAVCWEVAADTGAGLAEVVDALAENLTEQEEQRAEAAARTSGPRTTAIVLTGLPLVGVVMSSGLGGSPLAFLFTTPLGLACLVSGAALDALGAWWTLRMVRSATAVP